MIEPTSEYKISERTFGVEIEAYKMSRYAVRDVLQGAGINVEVQGYGHVTLPHWKIVHDSSISGQDSFEVVSPILHGEEGLRQVKVVLDTLKSGGAKVNKSCGLHVHFGANDIDLKGFQFLFKRYIKFEQEFDAFMPPSRRGNDNRYCQSLVHRFASSRDEYARPGAVNRAFKEIMEADDIYDLYQIVARGQRYYKLNLGSYFRHGTIEFRHHSGSVEAEKVINWILFTNHFLESAIKTDSAEVGEASFKDISRSFHYMFFGARNTKASASPHVRALHDFYRNRAKQFGNWEKVAA